MQRTCEDNCRKIEQILAHQLSGFILELRLLDFDALTKFSANGNTRALEDLISSAAECSIRTDVLRLDGSPELFLTWNSTPSVCVPLVFRHKDLEIHFRLKLHSSAGTILVDRYEVLSHSLTATSFPCFARATICDAILGPTLRQSSLEHLSAIDQFSIN